jgi:hypothetical protein
MNYKHLNILKMKTKKMFFYIGLISVVWFVSCEKEEIAKPEIRSIEIGYDNNRIGYVGGDLHIDVEVYAERKINTIEIEIHPEGEEEKSISFMLHDGEWEFDSVYTKFSGLINPEFHEHIEIPEDAETGAYHFHFIVTDQKGYQTSYEDEIMLEHSDGSEHEH